MNIIKSFMTKNPCYVRNTKKTDSRDVLFQKRGAVGLMLHSVGCSQPSAKAFVTRWNKSSYSRACVHGFIDAETGDVYQTLPWDFRGWHSGKGTKGTANDTHVGVEMCESNYIKYTGGSTFKILDKPKAVEQVERTYKSAVELFAQLCEELKLDPYKNIISHKEGHEKGIASNHGDPEHLWKGLSLPYTMDTFREDVAKKMSENIDTNVVPEAEDKKDEFMVRVIIPDLNYREKPSMTGKVLGQTGIGTFTIVETSGGWGKLKSGAGWIWLKNPKYCTLVTD